MEDYPGPPSHLALQSARLSAGRPGVTTEGMAMARGLGRSVAGRALRGADRSCPAAEVRRPRVGRTRAGRGRRLRRGAAGLGTKAVAAERGAEVIKRPLTPPPPPTLSTIHT